jgi:hypothetical protein
MATLALVNGNLSAQSRTACLRDHFAAGVERDGCTISELVLRALPATAQLGADFGPADPRSDVNCAGVPWALVIAPPVHKDALPAH